MSDPYDKQVGGDHYQTMKIQPAEFVNKNKMLFAEGNAIKYICRHINKGGKQDLEKAKHYIDMIIERDYGDETYKSQTFASSIMEGNDTPTGHGTLSDDIQVTYSDLSNLSISDEEGLPQDKTEEEITYTFAEDESK